MFGQMSRFLITADDLIAAQRALQHRMHAIQADSTRNGRIALAPIRNHHRLLTGS